MSKSQIVILFGRSGCGKGTQANLLIKNFGFEYLGSGALLRERITQEDFTGKKLKEVLDQGELVPTPIMFRVWAEKVEEMREKINKNGLIIDGSPRALLEAELMDHVFKWYGWKDIKVILLDIPEQEAFDRLIKRHRNDDKPEAIEERLAYFKKDVQPAINYYKKQGRLIKVDGYKSIKDVYDEIKKTIQ
ncbi:nucleoside monophosphate kinase [Patescibacteria group bacterium]|nr:nucleoside monophosphate kinase [Patescibacteria group bacterium]MBU1563846.1 nucleoside monophosphate kinase [Patescibacteria group bacterium]MBU2068358.1 nucleoside monophosphate kinase [Patescibacteria group bacterium]